MGDPLDRCTGIPNAPSAQPLPRLVLPMPLRNEMPSETNRHLDDGLRLSTMMAQLEMEGNSWEYDDIPDEPLAQSLRFVAPLYHNFRNEIPASETTFETAFDDSMITRLAQLQRGNSSDSLPSGRSQSSLLSEGSQIGNADGTRRTLFRGVRPGRDQYGDPNVTNGGAQLGQGIYFSDNYRMAHRYATFDPTARESNYTVDGKVYTYEYDGQDHTQRKKYFTSKDGGTVKADKKDKINKYDIVKTGHGGGGDQYRFSPDMAEKMRRDGALKEVPKPKPKPKPTQNTQSTISKWLFGPGGPTYREEL